MKKLACLLIAGLTLCAGPTTPATAQRMKRIFAPLPNGGCPDRTHPVIVNTPLGAQRGCQEN